MELYERKYESIVRNATINDLDEPILTEILQRLPSAGEATACKLVCKQWCSLISSSHFVSCFVRHHDKNQSMYLKPFAFIFNRHTCSGTHLNFQDRIFRSSGFKFKFLPGYHPRRYVLAILASYNDLILCRASNIKEDTYYICNPLTLQWVSFPDNMPRSWDGEVGFICGNEGFRVVFSRPSSDKLAAATYSFTVDIFCGETNKWINDMVVLSSKPKPLGRFGCRNIFSWNGFIHWFDLDCNVIAYNPYIPERCYLIDNPSKGEAILPSNFSLGASQGCLRLLQVLEAANNQCFVKIWQVKSYEPAELILTHQVSQCRMPLICPLGQCSLKPPMYLDPNDENMLYFAKHRCGYPFVLSDNEVYSFNIESEMIGIVRRKEKMICGGLVLSNASLELVLQWWPTTVPTLPQNAN